MSDIYKHDSRFLSIKFDEKAKFISFCENFLPGILLKDFIWNEICIEFIDYKDPYIEINNGDNVFKEIDLDLEIYNKILHDLKLDTEDYITEYGDCRGEDDSDKYQFKFEKSGKCKYGEYKLLIEDWVAVKDMIYGGNDDLFTKTSVRLLFVTKNIDTLLELLNMIGADNETIGTCKRESFNEKFEQKIVVEGLFKNNEAVLNVFDIIKYSKDCSLDGFKNLLSELDIIHKHIEMGEPIFRDGVFEFAPSSLHLKTKYGDCFLYVTDYVWPNEIKIKNNM